MPEQKNAHYILRGGIEGRERLRILARVMQPSALALLERVGVKPGMHCLDVGCGGGDLAFDLARMVGSSGRVVGTDIDPKKLELARAETEEHQLENVAFELADIANAAPGNTFDVVHARFVLTHLPDPQHAVLHMLSAVRPGGVLILQDVDFRGHFCHPENPAFARFVRLYSETALRRGVDANIGPRLVGFLIEAGLTDVQMNIVQPAGMSGDVKLIAALTMESIADSVAAEGVALKAEVDELVDALYDLARDENCLMSVARIVQVWGHRK